MSKMAIEYTPLGHVPATRSRLRVPIYCIIAFVTCCFVFSVGYSAGSDQGVVGSFTNGSHDSSDNAVVDQEDAAATVLPVQTKTVTQTVTHTAEPTSAGQLTPELFFQQVWRPSVKPDTPTFRPYNGFTFDLPPPEELHFHQPMGKNICIVDMDNRAWDEPGFLFSNTTMEFDNEQDVQGQSLGVLQHWIYAKIHGYTYYYVDIEEPQDRRSSWMKAPVMSKLLERHDACIYLDGDAVFTYPDLPIEWLMNYWGVDPTRDSMTIAHDPSISQTGAVIQDSRKNPWVNTGFWIAQNTPTMFEILQDWWDCPSEGSKWPGCQKFRFSAPGTPTDQGGFAEMVRYEHREAVKELDCNEANGYLESETACKGKFVTHVWTGKHTWLNQIAGLQMPGGWLKTLHRLFQEEKSSFMMHQDDLLPPGWDQLGSLGHRG